MEPCIYLPCFHHKVIIVNWMVWPVFYLKPRCRFVGVKRSSMPQKKDVFLFDKSYFMIVLNGKIWKSLIESRTYELINNKKFNKGQTCTKTFHRQVGICMQNFSKIGTGVWISFCPPHTNRQTNICTPIFIHIDRFSTK